VEPTGKPDAAQQDVTRKYKGIESNVLLQKIHEEYPFDFSPTAVWTAGMSPIRECTTTRKEGESGSAEEKPARQARLH
jgi:hypothetical protein